MHIFCRAIEIAVGLLLAITMTGCKPHGHADFHGPSSTFLTEVKNTQGSSADSAEVKTMISTEEILKLVNNDKPADELIKTIYTEAELKTFIPLSDILKNQPPECARYSNGKFYLIYKYDGGNYLFLMYSTIEEDSFPIASWYLGRRMYCSEFEELRKDGASFDEVQEFDPHGDYTRFYVSSEIPLYTLHYTVDGYLIRLDYTSGTGEHIEICEITKLSGKDNPLYFNLLPIDRELL